jgi:hypothetical protein
MQINSPHSGGLVFKAIIDLLLEPVTGLWLVRFQVYVVDKASYIFECVKVTKKFSHIVSDVFLLRWVLYLEVLLVKLANSIHAL